MLAKRIGHSGRLVERAARRTAALLLALLVWPGSSSADPTSVGGVLQDAKLYVTAPLRWDAEDWLYFGAALTAIGAAHEFDSRVRTHFVDPKQPLNGEDKNSARDALPAAALVVGTGLYAGDRRPGRLSGDRISARSRNIQCDDQRSPDPGGGARTARRHHLAQRVESWWRFVPLGARERGFCHWHGLRRIRK